MTITQGKNSNFVARMWRWFWTVAGSVVFSVISGGAIAQSPPLEIPFVKEWAVSPHARSNAEAFNHWNAEKEVPAACARCHSTPGFLDYIGADGTEPGSDGPAPVGTVISCVACHNEVTIDMTSVTFPSGALIENAGDDARCMTCHQGRESTLSVDKALTGKDDDTPDEKLKFINVHYSAAGATRYGTETKGGYEYSGKTYVGYFEHKNNFNKCADCHEQHTVKVKVAECVSCHKSENITKLEDLKKIRKSKLDYNGNGNMTEGVYEELATVRDALYAAIQAYSANVAGSPIVYNAVTYPYFFVDKNNNNKADANEAIFPNQYKSWTPRLLKAAYNYQFAIKDPGAYTHNPSYVIQIMYDSMADLASKTQLDMAKMIRPN